MDVTITVQGKAIRTDWIKKIERKKENNSCTVWFSIGAIDYYVFEGKDAETALRLLASHPALEN